MDFDEYQKAAKKYDLFRETNHLNEVGFLEKFLGLAGEAGEVTDKIKKIIRDKGGVISESDKILIEKELGDTLWYLAAISRYLGIPLSEVAKMNIEKLEGRFMRNKLHGEGDER